MARRTGGGTGGGAAETASAHFAAGVEALRQHPAFTRLVGRARFVRDREHSQCPPNGWAVVYSDGELHVHPTRVASPREWEYVVAHALLHLAFGHFRSDRVREDACWAAACDVVVARFLRDLKVGQPPEALATAGSFPTMDEERLYEQFRARGIPDELNHLGTAGPGHVDLVRAEAGQRRSRYARRYAAWSGGRADETWEELFAQGLTEAVTSALEVAAGYEPPRNRYGLRAPLSAAERARRWFIDHYPLLGALATSFRLIEDPLLCHRMEIQVAAVCARTQEVYINPTAALTEDEWKFVLAHEFLHVALQHFARAGGRDAYLWNVSCDFVINGWLREMQVGRMPLNCLYDEAFEGLSSESVYDVIMGDARRMRRVATFRGAGLGDILDAPGDRWWAVGVGLELDALYRRAIADGLDHHRALGRGTLPAGLIEAIRALSYPPIGWDAQLGEWFQAHFDAVARRRSFARPSRRQSATPDIPRPRVVDAHEARAGRTFGVVLDTSGTMDRVLLGQALGAIASYAVAHDVPAVRLVYCDAEAYDEGFVEPATLGQTVSVKGRGGTVLQPGIDLLERASDFPSTAPILIITDGGCDVLRVRREHAFLLPAHARLPFVPEGPVFRLRP